MPADSQKQGKAMSGGQRIDDHSSWMGGPGKNMVMPQGVHTKSEESNGHAGSLMSYEDTTEMVKAQQQKADRKVKSLPRRPLERN